jgi:hypothetical protein
MFGQVPDDAWQNYMLHFETVFRKGDEYREHGRNHFIQDQVTTSSGAGSGPGPSRNLGHRLGLLLKYSFNFYCM